MKRLLMALLAICILVSLGIVPASAEGNKIQLSSLSEAECRQFLWEHGVAIPEELEDISVKGIFALMEQDPNCIICVNTSTQNAFLEKLRLVVKEYYNLSFTSTYVSPRTSSLRYSTVYDWDEDTMPSYNCYAFAIGRTDGFWQPGDFSGGSYVHTAGVYEVAQVIKADLQEGLGYSCVKITGTRPESTAGWVNVIAFRKDTTLDFININLQPYNDFHFAKLTNEGWLHKPGRTAVLKFNNAPTNSVEWFSEGYNGSYHITNDTYDSDIVYFSYKTTHNTSVRTWTGEHYHSGKLHFYLYETVCVDCDAVLGTQWVSALCSGPPCIIARPYTIVERDASEIA